ncbi:hypothetical protein LCGC14_0338470 [marine sediment metagenome]|uniref:Uncharacterized protein n=1 Tax=marine sediment metagenome TaxID=412755 RepID=A0A0F9WM17_9ZZZZ
MGTIREANRVSVDCKEPGKRRKRCPKCGRLGVPRNFPRERFNALQHQKQFDGIGFTIVDSCHLPKDEYGERV